MTAVRARPGAVHDSTTPSAPAPFPPGGSGSGSGSVTVTGLRKDFGGSVAVDGISFAVPAGAFLVLLGPSGCGKTTTLRMLAGLEQPTGGQISFGDRAIARGDGTVNVPAAQREAGLVFQSYALWPHKTVRDNVEWPLKVAKWAAGRRRERVAEVLDLLAISELAERYPGEISGGQQQRVAIARMIAPEPKILLFDEPLSNLDAKLRVDTRGELMRIHRATGATSVYVTHDQVEAMTMATHVALMKDGRIEQFGSPRELLESPRTAFTSTFIGTPPANVLPCTVTGGRMMAEGPAAAPRLDCGPAPDGVAEGENVQVMFRATSITLEHTQPPQRIVPTPGQTSHRPALDALFADQVPLADRWVVGVDGPGGNRLSVVLPFPVDLSPGDPVQLLFPDGPDAVFGPDGVVLGGARR
ncbi:ABC transporter ATP-binding protein [Citricoccus sp. K5]|uniref:ABC transporter ATP-binding protein n=1 Tax=Citricoccus sp. K5 TaxID=2653135 RepID=UPI001359184B|nr:ABC transporter ATP-binding protein [Citricoccus sp. K5]